MADISVINVVKAFEEDKNILDGLSFEVLEGERVGLLGKNGAGKTTLFRIITGELESDEGQVVIAPGKRVGLVSQIPKYPIGFTGEDVLKKAHDRIYAMKRRMEELEAAMSAGDHSPSVMSEYDRLLAEHERLGGYDLDRLRNTVANGLGIPQSQREQEFATLSGGEKTRMNLARLILEDTDILLLDEPTNHLDMKATEWLEEYLLKFRGTVLTISHDRYFLDRVVTRTVEISAGKAEFYSGNYSFYVVEKQRRFDEQLKKYEKEQAEIKRLEESATRLYQWGTGNKRLMQKSFAIQSRIERMEKTERPKAEKKITTRFGEKEFFADEVLVMKGLTKSYGERTLFSQLGLEVRGGERIALIGDNGTGKSTLIKLIMGLETPDSGFVKLGPSVKTAYLPQVISFKSPHLNIVETMMYDENYSAQAARNRLGSFGFRGEDVYRPVSQLSGGEQSRLRLCILMKSDINLLILDEPTNHLDIDSREWIEDAVEDYGEALIFVSHDRYFISRFATRIWELSDGKIRDFRGSFEQYRAAKAMESAQQQSQPEKAVSKKDDVPRAEKPKKFNTKNAEKRLKTLEREIASLEETLERIAADTEAFSTDYEKLMELEAERQQAESALEGKYEEWSALEDELRANA